MKQTRLIGAVDDATAPDVEEVAATPASEAASVAAISGSSNSPDGGRGDIVTGDKSPPST